jgi:hypothetical protein
MAAIRWQAVLALPADDGELSTRSRAEHRGQAVGDNALRFGDHPLNDFGGRQHRVDQARVLAHEERSMIYIACESRCLKCREGSVRLLTQD